MTDEVLRALLDARERRLPCVLATVAATTGSVPREAGAKMLVLGDGRAVGTIGGGKFEALVVAECNALMNAKASPMGTPSGVRYSSAASAGESGGESRVFTWPGCGAFAKTISQMPLGATAQSRLQAVYSTMPQSQSRLRP